VSGQPIIIKNTGLVTSVGLSAPASCAAIRAKISNPTETRFMGSDGEWIMAHQVPLEQPWRGITKLAKMAAMAIVECLDAIPREIWPTIPLLLCVAERERPGRLDGLDGQLFLDIEQELGLQFAVGSAIIPQGRVSAAIALAEGRRLVYECNAPQVIIAATDSLLNWPTLNAYESADRLLTPTNSNGFMPGEGSGALLIAAHDNRPSLVFAGIGFGMEPAHIDTEQPLRADGLTLAHREALAEAGCRIHEQSFRITDLSGEQFYFKEADLALSRLLRVRQEDPELWHPAECIGESGALAGAVCLAVAQAAFSKGYAPGPGVLLHFSDDQGNRASIVGRKG
jgi:3-oxoacyl-[acyl-carrier-protein] synthase I